MMKQNDFSKGGMVSVWIGNNGTRKPTIARAVPMKISTGAASRLRTLHEGRKAHLLKLNIPAPCPPPRVFLVNQERGWEFFTQHVQFAISEGCDYASYVPVKYTQPTTLSGLK